MTEKVDDGFPSRSKPRAPKPPIALSPSYAQEPKPSKVRQEAPCNFPRGEQSANSGWESFRTQFEAVAAKEKEIALAKNKAPLAVECYFGPIAFKSPPGSFCVLTALGKAKMTVRKGPDERLNVRFETLAKKAAIALDRKHRREPLKFWLYRLFQYLRAKESHYRANESRYLDTIYHRRKIGKGGGGYEKIVMLGTISCAYEVSAIFCDHLEGELGSTTVQPQTQGIKAAEFSKASASGFAGLRAKKQDMSEYLSSPELTERQRDCMSLKFEYGLKTPGIAKRLNLHHSTVQEHLEAGERALQRDRSRFRRTKRRAIHPGLQDKEEMLRPYTPRRN